MKPQVKPEHYINPLYDSKERFISYWHQINEVILLRPRNLLEIGIGNGFVSRYLNEKGLNNTTMDIDVRLNPNIVGNILEIPILDESFDVVISYELLEHLPYSNFSKALKELFRVSQKNVILSLPDVTTVYRFNIELPRMKPIKKLIPHPFPRPTRHEFNGEHYWEIGKADYPLKKIKFEIEQARFKIVRIYRVFEFYYHRFFILEKL